MMIEINLLPWREKKRENEKKKLIRIFMALLIVAISMILLVKSYAINLINSQSQRNQLLRKEIAIFDGQLQEIKQLKEQKETLIVRMIFVKKLRRTCLLIVHLLDELVKLVPEGIYLSQLQRINDKITLQGFSESNNTVSLLMQGIERNKWMQDPILVEIKKAKSANKSEFRLSFTLKPKNTLRINR